MHVRLFLSLLLLSLGAGTSRAQVFEPTWESLTQYATPEWFRDAKLGIFMHWGPQSLPGVDGSRDGWYARHMYMQSGAPWGNAYAHHVQHYGHPTEFGYKDLILLWTAENWDPDALVQFYKEIGARYIVPVAVHHDNFDLWDSAYQPWNSVRMGPRRDIIGEWRAATLRHGLRFGVSSHSAQAWWWFQTAHGADLYGPRAGEPYDGRLTAADGSGTWWDGYDPRSLYGRPHAPNVPADAAFVDNWYRRHLDLLDKYEPDLLYFDGELPFPDEVGLDVAAHFYNRNQAWHRGRLEAVLNLKFVPDDSLASAVVVDIEKGQSATLRPSPWQTDTPLTGHWFYTPDTVTSDTLIVHNLCDIVSKNGNLLLNVALYPDGTIPVAQERMLRSVGRWLRVNGEAIYATRPWITYGEGPSVVQDGGFNENNRPFTTGDVRFTMQGDTLYAIFFERPASGELRINALREVAQSEAIGRVELLGYPGTLSWTRDAERMTVTIPPGVPNALAYVLRLTAAPLVREFTVRAAPNPFSGATRLQVQVPARERVTIRVLDVQGRLIQQQSRLVEPEVEEEFAIDLLGVASGVYLCHVTAGAYSQVVRLVHLGGR